MPTLNILMIEDEAADFLLIKRHLRTGGLEVDLHWVQEEAGLHRALEHGGWDVVLSDYKVPGLDFAQSLAKIKDRLPDVPVILISGSIGEETAVELFKSGLADFVLKDRLFRLIPAIERCLNEAGEKRKRRTAEARLVRNEQLMRSVLEGTADAVFVKDGEGKYLLFNAAAARFAGVMAEQVIGHDDTVVFPPATAQKIIEQDRMIMASGRVNIFEDEVLHVGGEIRCYLTTKGPTFADDGQVNGLFGIAHDITDRIRAEVLLKNQEEEYRRLSQEYKTLLDNVPDVIVHLTNDYRILWVNRAARQMFKLAEDSRSYQGRHCHEVFWSRPEQCADCPIVRCASTECNEIGFLSPAHNGQEFEIRAIPMRNQAGEIGSIIEIARDITAHRKLEEQFRQAQKMESIGTLAGGIAHDFNNILSAILGYGDLALEDMAEDHPARKSVQTMIEAGMRASHLTKDLLLFSRKQVSQKEAVDINQIIGRIEKFIRRIIGEDILCQTHLAKESLVIHADSHQMDQVLMNFATNARDAMPGGGVFSITTERIRIDQDFIDLHGFGIPGPYARITVADTGKGMNPQTVAKIFDPFFTTKEMGKGTGLGLAVVYGIIKQHQGHIEVTSTPGKCTVLTVYLPLLAADPHDHRDTIGLEQPRGGRETILLAEDEPTVRELYATVLKKNGYGVIEATDGEEAVRVFTEHKEAIDLLLFDLVMPKMNGKQTYEAIQHLQPAIKGIFISGYAPENIQQRELLDMHVEILFKPVSPRDLLRAVRHALDASRGTVG